MYRIYDKEAGIAEIQKYLHFVSDRIYEEVPRIAIDGIFGIETKEAVIAYQKLKSLQETGIVDFNTFTELYKSYQEAVFLRNAEDFILDVELFPLKLGDRGNSILLLHLMLDELQKIYRDMTKVILNDYYSELTEAAVRDIREIFMLQDSKVVDLELFDRMQYELEVRATEVQP